MVLSSIVDITERKKAEQALLDSEHRYRLLFENNPLPMWFFDSGTLAFLNVNEAAVRHYGYSREEFLSMTLKDIRPAEDIGLLLDDIVQGHEGLDIAGRWRHRKKDGTLIQVKITSHGIDYSGRPAKVVLVNDITERVKADEALKESERRLREMLENLQLIAMILDTSGTVTFCNDYLLALTGWEREEVINADWFAKFVPASGDHARIVFHQNILTGEIPVHYQNPIRTKRGQLRDIQWNNTLLRDASGMISGTASIGEDVTDRKRAEQELLESTERFRQLTEAIREVFWLTDAKSGEILYVSSGYREIWGRTCESLLANPSSWGETIHPDDRERVLQTAASKQLLGIYDEVYRIIRSDNSIRWIHDKAFPVKDQSGEVSRIAGIAEDITEQKSLEEQLRQAQKLESLGTLAGGIAHDFNNILGIVMGHASLLRRGEPDPSRIVRSTEAIEQSAQRGAGLVRQLLTFARKSEVTLEPVMVNETVREVVKLLEETLPKVITVSANIREDLPAIVADTTQVHQVLLNLCVNARDAMLPHGGHLLITTGLVPGYQLRPRFQKADAMDYVLLKVTDSGTGMDEHTRARIFEPFFTTKEEGKGTGLGLATVYGIVERHRGHIEVDSEVGRGTSFLVYFPVPPRRIQAEELPESSGGESRGGDETVLVVEDEEMLRTFATTMLESKGYRVFTASDGIEGMNVYSHNYTDIDLVLTDLGLPRIDGYAFIKWLKEINPAVRVIVMSGYIEPGQRTSLIEAGAKAIITKPFRSNDLLHRVREVLDAGGA